MAFPYAALDLLDVDSLYTEEERMIRDTVRSFVSERILPIVEQCNREARFPTELVAEMADLGLYGANLQGYGCAGVNNVAYGLIMQELERGDSGLRSFASVQGGLVMFPIHAYGSEEQKKKWLPELAAGRLIGSFGLTEADYGSNPHGMITRARKDGSHWILNGEKMWITSATMSDISVIWAKDESNGKVRGFVVEKGMPGYTTREIKNKWSLRVSDTSEQFLEDVRVPDSHRLQNIEGMKGPLSCLTQARYGIAWGGVGAAQACFDEALNYAKTRIQFDKPIASFQLIQKQFAEMATEITLGQLLCLRVGRLKDEGKATEWQVSMAKRNNVAMALNVARRCRDILGAAGICDDYQVFRHMCNLESVYTYEGTHNIHTLILGAHLTGIKAYS